MPRPRKKSKAGRKPVHDHNKLACICILMVCLNYTYRDMQSMVPKLDLPWNEPFPDHTTISKFMQKIPTAWLEKMIIMTAQCCIKGYDPSLLVLAADSTGVATDRHEKKSPKKSKNRHKSGTKPQKKYLKWHVASACKSYWRAVSPPTKWQTRLYFHRCCRELKRLGLRFLDDSIWTRDTTRITTAGSSESEMTPNIKQKDDAARTSKEFRKKASEIFDANLYKKSGIIEGIFGAEETKGHRLLCRFRKTSTRRRFGLCKAIGWNLEVLNRIECAAKIGIHVVAA